MAKGQKNSNREVRKPKQAKVKVETVAAGLTRGVLPTSGPGMAKSAAKPRT